MDSIKRFVQAENILLISLTKIAIILKINSQLKICLKTCKYYQLKTLLMDKVKHL